MKQIQCFIIEIRIPLIVLLAILILSASLSAEEQLLQSAPSNSQIVFSIESLGLEGSSLSDELGQASLLSDLHKYFGYAAVVMGAAAGIFNPAVADEDIHGVLGGGAAALSAATLGLGFAAHYDEIGTEPAWNSNLVHTIFGITGGTLMIIAPFISHSDLHPIVGGTGVVLMGTGIVWKLAF